MSKVEERADPLFALPEEIRELKRRARAFIEASRSSIVRHAR